MPENEADEKASPCIYKDKKEMARLEKDIVLLEAEAEKE